ncbi:MAG TPA: hypothetical protein VIF62_36910 [Labilithrix sp.]|jgi:hypothetical protein
MIRGAAITGLVALVLLGLAAPIREAHADETTDAQRRTVEVAIAGNAQESALLEDTMRELFARRGLSVVRSGAPRDAVLARVVVDLAAEGGARFVVADGRNGQVVLEKTMPREAGDAAIVREEIALAVRSAVESELLHDDSAPPPPAPPPPPPIATEPPPDRVAPPPRPPSAFAIDVTTFAGAGWVADATGPVARIGAGAAIASRRGFRPSLALTFTYAVPFETSTELISSHTNLVGIRAIPSVEVARTTWLALELGLGGGVDVLTVEPRSLVLPVSTLGESTTRGDAVFTGAVTARIAVASGVTLALTAASDVDPATRTYVLDDGATRNSVLALWHFRPTLLLSLGVTALGDGPFEAR